MGLHLRTSGDTGGGDGVDWSGEKPGADTLRPIPHLRPLGDSFFLIPRRGDLNQLTLLLSV